MTAWFSIAPDDGSGSYSRYVAEALDCLEEAGLTCRLGAMSTEIEGPPAEVFAAIAHCHEVLAAKPGVRRIESFVKVDQRIGASESTSRSGEGGATWLPPGTVFALMAT